MQRASAAFYIVRAAGDVGNPGTIPSHALEPCLAAIVAGTLRLAAGTAVRVDVTLAQGTGGGAKVTIMLKRADDLTQLLTTAKNKVRVHILLYTRICL